MARKESQETYRRSGKGYSRDKVGTGEALLHLPADPAARRRLNSAVNDAHWKSQRRVHRPK